MADGVIRFDEIDTYVTSMMRRARTPGLAVAFFDQTQIRHVATYGLADLEAKTPMAPTHLFAIGSITKTFTALATLQAVEKGLLDLQHPVSDYLSWFEVQTQYEPITLHHLLTHSSGLIGVIDRSPDTRGAVWALRETRTGWPPGSRFAYSDAGYQILSLVLEEVYQQPFAEILRDNIFVPLEMSASKGAITHTIRPSMAKGYDYLQNDRPHAPHDPLVVAPWIETSAGDCSIVSSVEDMAKFGRMLLSEGETATGRLLSAEGFARMSQSHTSAGWVDYGYGLMIHSHEGFRHIGHAGGMPGYSAELIVDTENQIGIAILNNGLRPDGLYWKLMSCWRTFSLGQSLSQLDLTVDDALHVKNVTDYVGLYQGHGKTLRVTTHGQMLFVEYLDQRLHLEERATGCFYVEHPDFALFLLQFQRLESDGDVAGPVTEILYGPEWYVKDGAETTSEVPYPVQWDAFVGHYRSHNPWQSDFRVILRKGNLLLVMPDGNEESLVPHSDDEFYVDEEGSPTRIRFDQIAKGQALRATYACCDYYRFFTP